MFDVFGDRDPRKMPEHLFPGVLHLDYSTAVKADISKQDFSVCPRHWYIDAAFRCARCGNTFVFSAEEQRFWYEELRFYIDTHPKRCKKCRGNLRELKALRQEYDRKVADVLRRGAEPERKSRIIQVIDALDAGGVELPEVIRNNRRILAMQVERLQGHRE